MAKLVNRIIQGDCIEAMSMLRKRSVDIVCCSPPYNLNIAYNTYKDKQPIDAYLTWFDKVAKKINRVLKDDGSFFLNVAGSNTQPLLPHLIIANMQKYFVTQNSIHWIKSISIGDNTHGQFKPINSNRYLYTGHEYIFHFTKTGKIEIDKLAVGVPYADKSNIARRGHKQDLRCRGNVVFIPYETIQSKSQKYFHPASYPIGVPLYCIKLHGKKHATVLDPFAGIFTTGLAAQKQNCNFIGVEIDKAYCKIGAKLLNAKIERIN